MSKNDGGPAFPLPLETATAAAASFRGMTLRDYAEVHFTAAWIHALGLRHTEDGYSDDAAVSEAWRLGRAQADAMLKERDR